MFELLADWPQNAKRQQQFKWVSERIKYGHKHKNGICTENGLLHWECDEFKARTKVRMQIFTLLVLPHVPSLPAATAAPLAHFFYIYPGFPRVVQELMAVAFKVNEVLKKNIVRANIDCSQNYAFIIQELLIHYSPCIEREQDDLVMLWSVFSYLDWLCVVDIRYNSLDTILSQYPKLHQSTPESWAISASVCLPFRPSLREYLQIYCTYILYIVCHGLPRHVCELESFFHPRHGEQEILTNTHTKLQLKGQLTDFPINLALVCVDCRRSQCRLWKNSTHNDPPLRSFVPLAPTITRPEHLISLSPIKTV